LAADVINIADYRKRAAQKQESNPALSPAISMEALPMLSPIFSGFGWFVIPVVVSVFVHGEGRG
jgi:hypothetical protein